MQTLHPRLTRCPRPRCSKCLHWRGRSAVCENRLKNWRASWSRWRSKPRKTRQTERRVAAGGSRPDPLLYAKKQKQIPRRSLASGDASESSRDDAAFHYGKRAREMFRTRRSLVLASGDASESPRDDAAFHYG